MYLAALQLEITNVSRQVEHLVLSLVVIRWRLNEKVLAGRLLAGQPIVAEGREGMRQDTVLVVLRYASELDDAVELL